MGQPTIKKDNNAPYAALFDFDGVVMDTEPQYSRYWQRVGKSYLGIDGLENRIKGQTLANIFQLFFAGMEREQAEITADLDHLEQEMSYEFFPGVLGFLDDLHRRDIKTAVVTSSNMRKMNAVYRVHPEMRELFSHILTAENFTRSKPDPECFLLGMEVLGATPETTFVFEDSFNGLKAAQASKATVIGLATTNARRDIEPYCSLVLDDFKDFTCDKMLALNNG